MADVINLLPYEITNYDHKGKKTLHLTTYKHLKSSQITCVYRVRSLITDNLYTFNECWSPILHVLNNKSADIIKLKFNN